ncbi:NIF-domain-containing protein [Schizopora paradoxa]|uniref:NIF-domain-containing protein n=1 Tax=Schizopora paradoxa TaxID=27342 RepID=A0A0H2RT50_9AGAM|nr:NIF-domain-containing protein [Schizopora paradoxa]
MNSLSYLSRQFDVIASTSASEPRAPPSTPTGEYFAERESSGFLHQPPLKRTRTWSARSFFIPSPAQTQEHQLQQRHRLGQTPRTRKRSDSTPNNSFFSLTPPPFLTPQSTLAPPESNASAYAPADAAPIRGQHHPPSVPTEQPPPPIALLAQKMKPMQSEMSWFRRMYVVRLLYLVAHWGWTVWTGFARTLRLSAATAHPIHEEAEADADTTADEKDSDDETSSSVGARSGTPEPELSASSSPSVTISVQQARSSGTSPLSQSSTISPTITLIPPPAFDNNEDPSVPDSKVKFPSSASTSQPQAATSAGSASGPSSSSSKIPPHFQKTLVLDLDETLIHSTTRPMFSSGSDGLFGLGRFFGRRANSGHMVEVVMGGRSTLYHVHKRPFVDYFLRKVSGWYTLVIFTASMQEYADPVIDWLDAGRGIIARRLFRESCTQLANGSYSKDLSVIEKDLTRICLVDNSPISYSINQANGIPIEGWTQDPNDEALLDLLPVLDSLRFTNDVRRVLGLRGF